MAEYRRNEIVSGLFVCLSLALFALFAFRVGGLDLLAPFQGDALVCKAYFTDVKTLRGGSSVMVGGQRIGKVTEVRMETREITAHQVEQLIDVDPSKAHAGLVPGMKRQLIEVTFEITDPDLMLNLASASVMLNQGSLLAPHFLELDPGEWSGDAVPRLALDEPDGAEIRAREGTGLMEKLYALVEPTVEQLERALETLNGAVLKPENTGAITELLANLSLAMADMRSVSAALAKLLDAERDPRIHEMIDQLGLASGNLERGSGSLARGMERFEGELAPLLAKVNGALDEASRLMLGATGTLDENRAEIAEAIRRMNEASWQLQLAMRKIRSNPAVLFFGDDETDFEAMHRDESGLRYSGRAAPYTQKDEE